MKKYIKQYDKRVGKTYVYENYPYWDKEKQQGRAKRKLVGIWDEERQEIVPTRGTKRRTKTPNEKTKELPRFEMKHYGANHMVRWLAEDIGLVDDLAEIFPDDYEEILALANYIVVNPDSAMHLFEEWAQDHYVFNAQALNSQAISRLFQSITVNEEQQFFQRQVNKVAKDDLLVYDTTSISSYSDQLSDVTYGKSKDNSRLPQIKLAVLMTQKQGIPVLYRQLPGNMTDSRLVDQLIKTMAMHQLDDYQLVFDRGFYKRENIEHLLSKGAKFVLGARIDVRFIRDHIDQVRETIDSTKHYLRSQKVYGVTVRDTT
ncbi:TPA: transposase, partial [Streptococcus suis]